MKILPLHSKYHVYHGTQIISEEHLNESDAAWGKGKFEKTVLKKEDYVYNSLNNAHFFWFLVHNKN